MILYGLYHGMNITIMAQHVEVLVVVSYICFMFIPILGEMIQFDEKKILMGWFNHQLVNHQINIKSHHFVSDKNFGFTTISIIEKSSGLGFTQWRCSAIGLVESFLVEPDDVWIIFFESSPKIGEDEPILI